MELLITPRYWNWSICRLLANNRLTDCQAGFPLRAYSYITSIHCPVFREIPARATLMGMVMGPDDDEEGKERLAACACV